MMAPTELFKRQVVYNDPYYYGVLPPHCRLTDRRGTGKCAQGLNNDRIRWVVFGVIMLIIVMLLLLAYSPSCHD